MKTQTAFYQTHFLLKFTEAGKTQEEEVKKRTVYKSDFKNHRFGLIDNKSIEDSANWESSWFAHYE
jgi:hypothetical protein